METTKSTKVAADLIDTTTDEVVTRGTFDTKRQAQAWLMRWNRNYPRRYALKFDTEGK